MHCYGQNLFWHGCNESQRPLMLMIGNLHSRCGAFTSRLLLYQIPSKVCGVAWSHSTPQTLLRICEAHSVAVNRPRRLGRFPIIRIKGLLGPQPIDYAADLGLDSLVIPGYRHQDWEAEVVFLYT